MTVMAPQPTPDTADSLLEAPASATSYADRTRAQQIHSMYVQSPNTTIGSLVAGGILVYGMWGQVATPFLLGWALVLCLHQAIRIYHYARYRRAQPAVAELSRWGRLYLAAVTAAGLIWGAAAYFMFVPHSPQHQTLLYIVLFGICSVSAIGLSAYAPAFYTLIPLTIVPFIARLLVEGQAIYYFMAAVAAVVLGVSLMFGRNMNRLITNSLRIRFENLDLIENLREQTLIAGRAREEAESANRAKTQFFAAASHDLRQPLHAIGLFASALNTQVTDPQARQLVGSVNQSVQALESLFNELLDISKIDSGIIKAQPRDFALSDVLDPLREDFAAEAAAKGLQFRVNAPDAVVFSDPVLLARILRNLIANALRYTENGEVTVNAVVSAGRLIVEVRDTGIGIAAADQQRIFEEFTQLQNPARTSRKGLGLGLSIVKRLCDLLGCRVAVRSQPGLGSTFGFEVPLGTALPAPSTAAATPSVTPAGLAGRLVVVIDDEETIVDGMQALLATWGAEVIGSASGEDVLDRVHAAGRLPDLLIVDYRLGGGDTGLGVVERLREALDPEIPAILVTGSITPDLEAQTGRAGLGFLLKPVGPQRLREAIDRALGAHR